MKKIAIVFRPFSRKRRGVILIPTLILLVLASLMIGPLLSNVSTGLKATVMYTDKELHLYSADAGIEDAFWQIKFNHLESNLESPGPYDAFDYTTAWTYTLPAQPNQQTVTVSLDNEWVPTTIAVPTPAEAQDVIDAGKLMVTGGTSSVNSYSIKLTYYQGVGENLNIDKIGIWLPPGATYKTGSSNLEQSALQPYYCVPTVSDYKGNQAVVWDYVNFHGPVAFTSFPGVVTTDSPMTAEITFTFNPSTSTLGPASPGATSLSVGSTASFPSSGTFSLQNEASSISYTGKTPTTFTGIPSSGPGAITVSHVNGQAVGPASRPDAVSWVNTSNVTGLDYSWDADVHVYKVISTSGETSVEAYFAKSQLRKMGSSFEGDYKAIGATLMRDTNHDGQGIRDVLDSYSSASTATIPTDAEVAAGYLYWTAWRDDAAKTTDFSDTCGAASNLTNYWVNGGDWTYSGGAYFGNHSPIDGLDSRRFLTLKNSENLSTYAPGTVFLTWDENTTTPTAHVNFLDACTSLANWNAGSCWTLNSGNFKGTYTAGGGRDISLLSGLNLTTEGTTGSITLSWAQTKNGTITAGDGLDFSYSLDGGSTWTTNPAFRGPNAPASPFSFTIPAVTLPSDFRLKFSLVGFASPLYCTLDNIQVSVTSTYSNADWVGLSFSSDGGITWSNDLQVCRNDIGTAAIKYSCTVPGQYLSNAFKFRLNLHGFGGANQKYQIDNVLLQYMPPDNSVMFKIDGQQVYFDASGNPASGAQQITSSKTQVLPNWSYLASNGYSYSGYRDVTALLKTYGATPPSPATNHPGNGTYTVGNVTGVTGNNWSYAGWSLIIIYNSADTLGHQLYLYDQYQYANHDSDIDFDNDGVAGGTISGFIVPPQIVGETVAATLTAFVGEGDDCWTGDFIALNAPISYKTHPADIPNNYKLWDGITTGSNTSSAPNNVWNSKSVGLTSDGIDIDTFSIPWSSGLIQAGDTTAQIDLPTGVDVWNLVYMIISFRSANTTGNGLSYLIHG
jgi:hypothetical protein